MNARQFSTYLAVVVSPAVIDILALQSGGDEQKAFDQFYSSAVYAALADEGTKMWHYSPELIASLVEEELRTGSFTYPQEAL